MLSPTSKYFLVKSNVQKLHSQKSHKSFLASGQLTQNPQRFNQQPFGCYTAFGVCKTFCQVQVLCKEAEQICRDVGIVTLVIKEGKKQEVRSVINLIHAHASRQQARHDCSKLDIVCI